MPWIDGGTPVTIDELLTLVNVGMAARATALVPSRQIRCRFGMIPRNNAAFRYSSAEPSRQIATRGRGGQRYARPFASKEEAIAFIAQQGIGAPSSGSKSHSKKLCE